MIDKKYLYKKEYYVKGNYELILKNPQLINEYIDEKANLLIKSNDKNHVISEIILDIINLIDFDINNSSVIGMPISSKIKCKLVQKYDIIHILGNIFLEYHLDLINNNRRKIPSVNYRKYVIDYNNLYDEALTDYFKKILNKDFDDTFNFKKNRINNINLYDLDNIFESLYGNRENIIQILTEYRGTTIPMPSSIPNEIKEKERNNSYLASFVFPALIERNIIDHLREYYFDLGIKRLSEKDSEIYNNDEIERKAMTQIRSEGKFTFFYDEEYFRSVIINMFKKYAVLNSSELEIFGLITIGNIFNVSKKTNKPSFFAECFKKEYYYLYVKIFNFLNIRNNTMHLINTNENYFSVEFSSILLQLLWLSLDDKILDLKYWVRQ